MTRILLVGLGGGVGSILRYALGRAVQQVLPTSEFPWGTLAVNVLGAFVMGLLAGWAALRGGLAPETRALVVVGLLGGFTTFSAFGAETVDLLLAERRGAALAYVVATLAIGLLAVGAGRFLASPSAP